MTALRGTVIEMLVLGVIGLALGIGANAVRGSGSIRWTKNYLDKGPAPVDPDGSAAEAMAERPDTLVHAPSGEQTNVSKRLRHPYRTITLEELTEGFTHPDEAVGHYVFVDSRRKTTYDQGHIEGAIQCDPYHVADCIDRVLDRTRGAEKVIVYCNGGKCEDSIFMCRELRAADVPSEAIFIYPGGWTEWRRKDMPTAKACESP